MEAIALIGLAGMIVIDKEKAAAGSFAGLIYNLFFKKN